MILMSPNTILALNEWPKVLKISSEWRNLAKSGHTDDKGEPIFFAFLQQLKITWSEFIVGTRFDP